jgi:glutathionylspermidine synthase
MQRIPVDERSDWRELAEQSGFVFHSINGERYWDESAYYAFSLKQIEDDLEAPTAALDAMCSELVGRAVTDDRIMQRLAIPEPFWDFIAASWKRRRQPLWALRPALRRARAGQDAGIQRRHADLGVRSGGVSMGLAR